MINEEEVILELGGGTFKDFRPKLETKVLFVCFSVKKNKNFYLKKIETSKKRMLT